jgi:hypothetical protein
MDAVTFLSLSVMRTDSNGKLGGMKLSVAIAQINASLASLSAMIELLEQCEGGPCFYIILVSINMFLSYSAGEACQKLSDTPDEVCL